MIGKSGMRETYFVVVYIIYMNIIYMQRGSVEANFRLHGCKTANFTYFQKKFPAFVRCPVSGVIRVVTKKSITIRLPDDTWFFNYCELVS